MSSAFLAASCFAIITAPLAIFGTYPLNLELGELQLYRGKLEDVASPYLGAAAAASLALGALASRKFAQRSAQKSSTGVKSTHAANTHAATPKFVGSSLLSGESAPPMPVFLSRQHLLEQGLDAFLEPELDIDDAPGMLRQEPPLQQVPAEFRRVVDPAASRSAASDQTVVTETVLAETVLTETVLAPSNPNQIRFQPQIHPARPAGDLVLESWAEAFLSDAPLVSLQRPNTAALIPQIAPVAASGQQPDAKFMTPLGALPEVPWGAPLSKQAVLSKPEAASQVVPFHHLHASAPVMPAAQTYLSFVHVASSGSKAYSLARDLNAELAALEQLETVREQIQTLSAQMELIQAQLNPQALGSKYLVAVPSTPQKPTYTVVTTEVAAPQPRHKPAAYQARVRGAVAS